MIRMRRTAWIVGAFLLAAAWGQASLAAQKAIEIQWEELIPDLPPGLAMNGVIEHGQLTLADLDKIDPNTVVKNFDGKTVKLAGFVVPLAFDGTMVREFLLVPYVGACIHVPPPPANQIVYVQSAKGIQISGLFDPVVVTGVLSTSAINTELADVGYRITADRVDPYKF